MSRCGRRVVSCTSERFKYFGILVLLMTFEKRYYNSKDALLSDTFIVKCNRDLFQKFFEWEEEKLKRQNGLPKLDEASYKTLCGYINRLKNVNKWFGNNPWNKLTETEIKKVYNDLEDGKIKNWMGKRFDDRKSYYNKIFKAKPFQLAGLSDKAENALEFFTDRGKREVRFISEEGFKRMVGFLQKPQHIVLFWLAWDIGENIATLLELKVSHFKRQVSREIKEAEYLVYLPQNALKRSRQSRSEPTIYQETVRYLDALFKYGREVEYRDEKGKIRRKTVTYKEDDFLFSFKYRQALQIFDSVISRSGVKCEPHGEKPSWKDLRSGMACHLFAKGWHVEDINLRLGHSPQSKWLEAYVNYLAVNRKRAVESHFNSSLEDLKIELEESKQREKLIAQRLEKQKQDIEDLQKELGSLKSGKGILTLLASLGQRQNEMSRVLQKMTGQKFDVILPEGVSGGREYMTGIRDSK